MMTQFANYALFVAATPFCLWATWSDLRYMKIPNRLVVIMAATFLVVGGVFLPLDAYLWRLLGGLVVLAAAFLLFSVGGIGGGDAKFAAVMALFIKFDDIGTFLFLLAVITLVAVLLHWLFGKLPFTRPITTTWESWSVKKKFPLGFGMGTALIFYLAWAAFF